MARKEQLPRVTGEFMQELYENQQDRIWADDQMVMIRRNGEESERVFSSGQPYQITSTHIGIVMDGEADIIVNLRTYHIKSGMLLVNTPESVMQMKRKEGHLDMQTIHIRDEMVAAALGNDRVQFFRQRMNAFITMLSDEYRTLLLSFFDSLWLSLHSDAVRCREGLIASIIQLVIHIYAQAETGEDASHENHNIDVLNQFLDLVNKNCHNHRDLDFYADKICLSKQYLSSIISEVSRQTAKEWIEEATITRMKVLLRHSDLSLNEISSKMSFPEPSHFSRYFKRLTGMTPAEYRKGGK